MPEKIIKRASEGGFAGEEAFVGNDKTAADINAFDSFVPKAPVLSAGTDDIKQERKTQFGELRDAMGNIISDTERPTGSTLADLQASADSIKTTTDEELKRIEEAGEAAGAAFDPYIDEARESRKHEMAAGVVRAGEAGGFESTQLAGTAAVLPTYPRTGEAFVGAGGKLSQQRVVLDRNISLLLAKQQEAIGAAKAAERKAQRTGKREDLSDALNIAKFAQDIKSEADNMMIKKEQLGLQYAGEARAQQKLEFDVEKFNIGEARAQRTADLAEAKFNYTITQDIEDRTIENIKNMANSRIALEQLSDEQITKLEYEAGMEPGTFEAFYSKLGEDAAQGDLIDDLKVQQMKASIANSYSAIAKRNKVTGSDLTYNEGLFETAQKLKNMRDQGMLSDPSYDQAVSKFMQDQELESDDPEANQNLYNQITSQVNDLMGGRNPFIENQTTEDAAQKIIEGFTPEGQLIVPKRKPLTDEELMEELGITGDLKPGDVIK